MWKCNCKYALIGAGAVVTKDVPDYAVMVGNPATQTGWCSDYGAILGDDLVCPNDGTQYELKNKKLVKKKNS